MKKDWNHLSQREKAEYIRLGIKNGLDLQGTKQLYEYYQDQKNNQDYDTSAYLENNKQQAFSHINGQHYPDTYKKPNHPTFSDESIYSTKETPGGHWEYQNGKDVFYPSEWQIETFGNNYISDGGYLDNLTTKPFSYQPIPEVRYKKGGFLKNTIDWLSSLFGLNQDETQQSEGIDLREIAARQAYAESGFDSNAKSNAGAMGLFQIMPSVLQDYNTKNNNTIPTDSLTNDSINTNVRNWYMNDLMNRGWNTKNNPSDSVRVAKVLGAYNWGSGNLVNALNKAKADGVDIYNSWDWLPYLAPETRDYIDFILMGNNNSLHRNNIAYKTKSKQNQEKVDNIKNSFVKGGNLNSKNVSNKNREIAKIKSKLEQLAINNNFSAEELKELRKFDEKSEVYKRAVELYKKYKYDF